jgi:hypothetical protein
VTNPIETEPLEHVVLPVHLPDLSQVKNEDVKALRDRIYAEKRKARKEATKLIAKEPKLRDLWMVSLGTGPEETKNAARVAFEIEIMRYPEVFLKHAWANALTSLENALQGEMIERSKLGQSSGRRRKG